MKVTDAGWGTLKDAEGNIYSDDGSGVGSLICPATGELFWISKRDGNENALEIVPYYDFDQAIEKIMADEKCDRPTAERFYMLSQRLTAEDFTPEKGREIYKEVETLRSRCSLEARTEIYTAYAERNDITFILKDTYKGEDVKSTECIGWYYGEPNDSATATFSGKLKAEY